MPSLHQRRGMMVGNEGPFWEESGGEGGWGDKREKMSYVPTDGHVCRRGAIWLAVLIVALLVALQNADLGMSGDDYAEMFGTATSD